MHACYVHLNVVLLVETVRGCPYLCSIQFSGVYLFVIGRDSALKKEVNLILQVSLYIEASQFVLHL